MRQMSELALTEAASLLSIVSHREIRMSVSSIGLFDNHQTDHFFADLAPDLTAICQHLEGAQRGEILFILPQQVALLMIRQLLNDNSQFNPTTELEEEALSEIGNIIINSFLSHSSQVFKGSVTSTLPQLSHGQYTQLFRDLNVENAGNGWCYLQVNISTQSEVYTGFILCSRFIMNR